MKIRVCLILSMLVWPLAGQATTPMEGYLIAQEACPAYHSIRKSTNPGNITLTKGMAYEVTGKNKADATHYLIKVEGAEPLRRWVAISCGKLLVDCKVTEAAAETAATDTTATKAVETGEPTTAKIAKETHVSQDDTQAADYLLAASWQPAFCQTHQAKPECSSQTADRYDAVNFALHGLWPQPRGNAYCGVSTTNKSIDRNKRWDLLPQLDLSEALREQLAVAMPGYQSYLHRHEWIKHGTCYSDSEQTYYEDSLLLMQQLNESVVREFMVANIGKKVTATAIRSKFDEAFGAGAGEKVKLRCKKGMIEELWINLRGTITPETTLRELLKTAEPAKVHCDGGLVDPVGF